MLFGFNDDDTEITDKMQIIENVKGRIQELETEEKKQEESESESQTDVSISKIDELKTLLYNLELLQDLPTKHHLFKSMVETI